MSRQKPNRDTELAVLAKSKRRCALCFHLESDTEIKRGQIAHIDDNSSNSIETNLVWLCLKHHDDYHVKSPMTKSITKAELIMAKHDLEEFVRETHKKKTMILPPPESSEKPRETDESVSVDIYNLRIPIYRAFIEFVANINSETEVNIKSMYRFRQDTHETLFLYGYEIQEYLREVDSKAIKLRAYQGRMKDPSRFSNEKWDKLVNEETNLILWFSEQIDKGKYIFYKYLKILIQQTT